MPRLLVSNILTARQAVCGGSTTTCTGRHCETPKKGSSVVTAKYKYEKPSFEAFVAIWRNSMMEEVCNSKARFPLHLVPVEAREWLITLVCLYNRKKFRVKPNHGKRGPRLVIYELLKLLPSCQSDIITTINSKVKAVIICNRFSFPPVFHIPIYSYSYSLISLIAPALPSSRYFPRF